MVIFISNLEIFISRRSVPNLREIEVKEFSEMPLVSIIVPSRNEEHTITPALESLLQQQYPNYEVIAINDRSTDRTGEILDEFAERYSHLRVIHVNEIPTDWLGKNHALYLGSTHAKGNYLLYTDADVEMAPQTIHKTIQFMLDHKLDHVAVAPEIQARRWSINMMIGTFIYHFGLSTKPWRAQNPKSRYFVGIGAFNLVKTETYRAIGTHQAIALRPDDDIMLGKLVKTNGYRQQILFGKGMVRLVWYETVREMIAGLMKNTAAAFHYNWILTLLACLMLVLVFVFPFAAVFFTPSPTRWIYLATSVVIMATYFYGSGEYRLCRWYAFMIPFTTLLFIYILLKSTFMVYKNRGIFWRDTYYPLEKLKQCKV
jgi:glycosyltransferase involved in cell wall biosynthesis